MKNKKVILGMSGGVDSSVAAFLLQNKGYKVHGYFMNCGAGGERRLPSTINWREEEIVLREICRKLGIELYMADCEVGYEKKIIELMIKDYEKGLTPNPDVLCNTIGKFPNLLKIADKLGAEYIATGHYAIVKDGKLYRGKDEEKDQSYFICTLNEKILKRCIFPLGELKKEEVRKIARANGFPNWSKRSSRGICYLGKIDVKKFLKEKIKEKTGEVISPDGKIIGTHPGVMFFTIGERAKEKDGFKIEKKFKKENPGKLFIAEKTEGNKIIIAPKNHLLLKKRSVFIHDLKPISESDFPKTNLKARIRHLGELHKGKLRKENLKWAFTFDKGVEGVAAGQYIALYKNERVIASGIII